MHNFTLTNPVFATYVAAAALMILKGVAMSWLTVVRMMGEKGGFRSPEDLRKTALNPAPHQRQIGPNDRVDRIRRIQLNDLENLPYFLVAGLLYVATGPAPLLATILFYAYVVTRLLHFVAYLTAQNHEVRAALWTPGSLIIVYMSAMALVAAWS